MNDGKTTICMPPRESLLHLDAVVGEDCGLIRIKGLFVRVSGVPSSNVTEGSI
mgnify:CR=1 FL=1